MRVWMYEPAPWGARDILESDESGSFVSKTRKNFSVPADFVARHSSRFAFGGDGEADTPKARFSTLRELSGKMFKIEQTGNGMYAIRNVPLYKAHPDSRKYGITCDEKFLDRMVRNFYETGSATTELFGTGKFAWKPKLHWGHTSDDPDVEERENAGFIDNLYRVQDFLVGDYVGLDKATLDKLVSGKYPDRSAEVDLKRARLLSVAALGFRTPHFALPQMNPQELREHYLAVIQKNAGEIREVENSVLLQEDLPMAATKTKKATQKAMLTADQVAKFFMDCSENEEMNSLFESAVEKHCDMMGMMPQGGGLMQIIQQVMQQMMGQKMNSSPPGNAGQAGGGGGGFGNSHNASDVLDMESRAHHEAGEQDLDEEGTSVAEGKSAGDADVDSDDGTPSVEGKNEDTVSESGKVVKKSAARIARARNTLSKITDRHVRDQVGAAFEELNSGFDELSSFVESQHQALTDVTKELQIQRNARRRETYKNRFQKMFERGNPNASCPDLITKHLKIVMGMDDAAAEEYLGVLEAAPSLTKTRHVAKGDVVQPRNSKTNIERYQATIDRTRGLKKAGVKAEHLAAVDIVDSILSGDSDEEEID